MSLAGALLTPFCPALMSVQMFLFSVGLFVGGYALQFLGHACEGTKPGEVIQFKLWLDRRSKQRRTQA